MKALILILSLVAGSAFAKTSAAKPVKEYDLQMVISMNGKPVMSPFLVVKPGEKGTLRFKSGAEDNFVEVTVNEGEVQKRKGILMKFNRGTFGKNTEKNTKNRIEVLAQENEKAEASVTSEDGSESFSIVVVAKRRNFPK